MEDRPSFGNAGAGDGSVHKRCMKAMEDPRPPVVPCLRNGGIRFTIIGNKYYFEPSSSAAHHLQQRLKEKLGDVRSAVDDDFIQLAISRRHLHNQKENLEEEDDLLLANAVQIEQQDLFPQLFA
ncbi:unnamed protein product [Sphagnum troendelagicum]